ncbi:Clavaminate synthase-like protein [Armillaria nabsnona]|nr:Clavaminate synthase-like protein [Armillaria nabsnona]
MTINHYSLPQTTKKLLDYADLPIIDLSKSPHPDEVHQAMETHGFFYVVGHRLSPIDNHVSDDKKRQYEAKIQQTGSYQGYKLRKFWVGESHIDNRVRDEVEIYSSGLLALGLGLPEDALVDLHGYSSVGESYGEVFPHSSEDEEKTNGVWTKGHTDIGSITILYSQPVAALQMLTSSGEWKWVRHLENALVINAGDALEFLSGGTYRATIHCVFQPPKDQRGYTRLGVFYFCMPDDNVKLLPLVAPKGRTAAYGNSQLNRAEGEERIEEEVIKGVMVKHYN